MMKKIIFAILALFVTSSVACAATSDSAVTEVKATHSEVIFLADKDKDDDKDDDVSPSYKDADHSGVIFLADKDKDDDKDDDVSPSYKDIEPSIG